MNTPQHKAGRCLICCISRPNYRPPSAGLATHHTFAWAPPPFDEAERTNTALSPPLGTSIACPCRPSPHRLAPSHRQCRPPAPPLVASLIAPATLRDMGRLAECPIPTPTRVGQADPHRHQRTHFHPSRTSYATFCPIPAMPTLPAFSATTWR